MYVKRTTIVKNVQLVSGKRVYLEMHCTFCSTLIVKINLGIKS